MIGRLTGILLEKNPPQVLVDVHGVGYEVDVPMSTFYNLPAIGEKITLLTHFVVREDGQFLFGFASGEERYAFRQLIKQTWIHQNAVGFSSLSIQNQFLICDFCAICVFDETILPVLIQRRSEVIEENLVFSRLPRLKIRGNRHISKLFI